ncbi:hypothetical protein BC833DRAFT_441031 [Globomyces pollinis-pini]|nr:hypothetical protein BC833DRAFT_441031 [Globomyces pollinis-pini]
MNPNNRPPNQPFTTNDLLSNPALLQAYLAAYSNLQNSNNPSQYQTTNSNIQIPKNTPIQTVPLNYSTPNLQQSMLTPLQLHQLQSYQSTLNNINHIPKHDLGTGYNQMLASTIATYTNQFRPRNNRPLSIPVLERTRRTPDDIEHHKIIKTRIGKSIEMDSNKIFQPNTTSFTDTQDVISRLLAYHLVQLQPITIPTPDTDITSIVTQSRGVITQCDGLFELEEKIQMGICSKFAMMIATAGHDAFDFMYICDLQQYDGIRVSPSIKHGF